MAVLSPRFLAALAAAPNPWAEQIVHQVRSVGGRIPHDTGDYSIPHPDPASAPIGKLEYLYYPENPVRQRPGRIMVKTIDTHPDYRRQGVARSLMQQMHDDHPNIAIDPGYTTGYGEALKQQLLKENPEKSHLALPGDPSSAPPRTGLRTARGTPLFVYRQAIELTDEEAKVFMDFVNQQKGPIKTKIGPPQKVKPIPAEAFEHLFKRQNPSGTWYHASPHDLPMGTKLVPGGAPAASKDFYEQGFGEDTGTLIDMGGGRNKHVWMTPDLDDAHFWSAVNQAPHIYEVDPERDPAPWNGSGTDGWVAPSATITRKVAHRELTPEEMELHQSQGWRGEPCCDPSHGEGHLSGRCSVCGKRTSYAYEDMVPQQRASTPGRMIASLSPRRTAQAWLQGVPADPLDPQATMHSFLLDADDAYDQWDWFQRHDESPPIDTPNDVDWFHATPADLPIGTILAPLHGNPPWTDKPYHGGLDNRAHWTWVEWDLTHSDDWIGYMVRDHGECHLYQVRPRLGPFPWNGSGREGWVTDAAVIIDVLAHYEGTEGNVRRVAMPTHRVSQQRVAALPPYQAPTQPIRVHRGVGIIMTPELRQKIKAGLDWGDDFNPQFKHFSIGPAILDHMEQTQQGGMQDNPGLGHYWSEDPTIAENAAHESLTYNNLGWDEHGHRQIPAVVSGIWDGKGQHATRISEDPHLGEHVLGPDARIAIDSVRIPMQEGYGKGPWMEVYNDPDSPDWGHLGNQQPSIRHASLPDPWADQIQHRPRGEPGRGPGGTYFIPHPSISGDEAGSLTYTRYPPEEEYAKPFLGIDWLTTHPEVQRQWVATSLLRRMVKDHPGYQVNPGYTSESGTKLRKHLWENEPSAQDIMTHAMRVLEAAGTFKLKEMIPGDLDWLEEGGNPATYLPEKPSGKWYHTSPYEMKPGDRIVPGGAPSPGGEGEWSFYEKGKSNRPNHVWLSRNPDEAKWWRNWAGHGANIYEVKPGDRPQPWNLSGGQGWVAPHATVIRKVDVGPHTYMDSLIPPEERRVAQSHAPYYIDESPWYSAVWDEDLDEDEEEAERERKRKSEIMVRKRLSQTGIEPDMNVRKQLNKFTDRIYRARQNGDHAVADYYEHLRDMMLADVEAGVPKPFSYYEPMLQEEFDL